MQNPLRRPKGKSPPPKDRDVEHNQRGDAGYLAKDVRGHLVAMSGEFVGTFMFLYFAFAATQIASMSNFEACTFLLHPTMPRSWDLTRAANMSISQPLA